MDKIESREDYLERILILSEDNHKVKAIDIANSLNYSKASVSVAMKKLLEEKLININNNSNITLTKEGEEIAKKVYERHTILAQILMNLGVSKEVAFKDACKMEHDISDETFEIIKKHIQDK